MVFSTSQCYNADVVIVNDSLPSQNLMQIIVGSTNPVKIQAVQVALHEVYAEAKVSGVAVPSGVADQPWNDAETRQGAYNRAQAVLDQTSADVAVGLEGGVLESEFGLMTSAWCVILDRAGHVGVGGNSCTLLPPSVADHLQRGVELGIAMDRFSGQTNTKHKDGAIGILTDGLVSRQTAYEIIIKMALAPLIHPAWYAPKAD